jgi:hypothetical protein
MLAGVGQSDGGTMKRRIFGAGAVVGLASASLGMWALPANAATEYQCQVSYGSYSVTVTTTHDRVEDFLESLNGQYGLTVTCTGD